MTNEELIRTLREYADWADGNEWEVPLMLADHLRQAAEKLEQVKAYEDTGLTPEEIGRVVDAYGRGQTLRTESALRLGMVRDIRTDRLRELAKADKDGRVVVLPCKVGDTVWRIVRDGEPHITRDEVRDMYFADDMPPCVELVGGRVTFTEKFGKTVFLSREEAERALQEMEGKKDGKT